MVTIMSGHEGSREAGVRQEIGPKRARGKEGQARLRKRMHSCHQCKGQHNETVTMNVAAGFHGHHTFVGHEQRLSGDSMDAQLYSAVHSKSGLLPCG